MIITSKNCDRYKTCLFKNVYSSKYFDYEYNNQKLHFNLKMISGEDIVIIVHKV